ncbi:MAG: hypothetical protein FWG28_07555 [Clostridiales bacterium]|nr:hypothetical protein [Clostridiales bacterium]
MLYYPREEHNEASLAVVAARYQGSWLYVRHEDRKSFAFPSAVRADGESLLDAAGRALKEAGGVPEFTIWPVTAFGALEGERAVYGRLFFAAAKRLGSIASDNIAERSFFEEPAGEARLKDTRIHFLDKVEKWLIDRRTTLYCVSASDMSNSRIIKTFEGCGIDSVLSSPDKSVKAGMSHLAEDRGLAAAADPNLGPDFTEDLKRKGLAVFREILEEEKGRSAALGLHSDAVDALLQKYSAWLKPDAENIFNKYMSGESRESAKQSYTALLEFIDDTLIGVRDSWMEES